MPDFWYTKQELSVYINDNFGLPETYISTFHIEKETPHLITLFIRMPGVMEYFSRRITVSHQNYGELKFRIGFDLSTIPDQMAELKRINTFNLNYKDNLRDLLSVFPRLIEHENHVTPPPMIEDTNSIYPEAMAHPDSEAN